MSVEITGIDDLIADLKPRARVRRGEPETNHEEFHTLILYADQKRCLNCGRIEHSTRNIACQGTFNGSTKIFYAKDPIAKWGHLPRRISFSLNQVGACVRCFGGEVKVNSAGDPEHGYAPASTDSD